MSKRQWARYSSANKRLVPLPQEWLEPLSAERVLELVPRANAIGEAVARLCREAKLEPGNYSVSRLMHSWHNGDRAHPAGSLVLRGEGPLYCVTEGPEEPTTQDFALVGNGMVCAPRTVDWIRAVYKSDPAQAWHLFATAWPNTPAGVLLAVLTERTVEEKKAGDTLIVTVRR